MRALPLVIVTLLLGLAACKKPQAPADPAKPHDSYKTGGVVKAALSGNPPQLSIHHKDIPEFKDASGEVRGMPSMEMPFGLAPGVKADDLKVDDFIDFTFETHFGETPVLVITEITNRLTKTMEMPQGKTPAAASGHEGHEGHAP